MLLDVAPEARDSNLAAVVLKGDAVAVAGQLQGSLGRQRLDSSSHVQQWKQQLQQKVCGSTAPFC